MIPMLRPPDETVFDGDDPLLDLDALDVPRRLSRDEGRAATGPDWSWTHLPSAEEDDND